MATVASSAPASAAAAPTQTPSSSFPAVPASYHSIRPPTPPTSPPSPSPVTPIASSPVSPPPPHTLHDMPSVTTLDPITPSANVTLSASASCATMASPDPNGTTSTTPLSSTFHCNANDPIVRVPSWVDLLFHSISSTPSNVPAPSFASPSPAEAIPTSSSSASLTMRRTPSVNTLVSRLDDATGLSRIRLSLLLIRHPHAPSLSPVAMHRETPSSLVSMLSGTLSPHFSTPHDRASVIVAAHTLCNNPSFQTNFLAAGGLISLCDLLRPVIPNAPCQSSDRVTTNSGVFAKSPHRPKPSSDSDSALFLHHPDTPATPTATNIVNGGTALIAGSIHRIVWNAAIRTIAKLMVIAPSACAQSIDTGSLAFLAKAAKPGEPMDIRLRAAAGLAAIAAWSGPRRAVDIVQTDDVVLSMTAILAERDDRIPNDLRTATIDGLVVMSFRRHARGVLQRFGCEDKIKTAARYATVSGDYTAAARSTVAAGHLTGRSVDEYGFLVQDEIDERGGGSDGPGSAPETPTESSGSQTNLRRRRTGLEQIQQQLLEEPYAAVEDLNVLEEIVHEEAGVLSSSPRDRNYIRRAARTYVVSGDEIEFISVLEEEASPSKGEERASTTISGDERELETKKRIASSLRGSVEGHDDEIARARRSDNPVETLKNVEGNTSPQRSSGSSPRESSQFLPMQDPDFDGLQGEQDIETASTATALSSKSKKLSPLLMFSSATKKAAERDGLRTQMVKTNSQLSRDTENEQRWKEVMEQKPDMLKREGGRSNRVVAYRELALVPVPPSYRRKLWPLLLETSSLRATRPSLYRQLCEELETQTLADDIEHTIDADVTRTMPLHSLFWAGGAQVGVQSLRSILRAYAKYVPEVGYCQGMSSIAAVLLMNAADEEEAFLMMVQFMSRFQYKRVFAPGFPLMMQWIEELKPLVAHYMPELNAHLERENVPLEIYADKWLITALSHNFPHRHLLRVWDLMFLGGSPKIVMKACLMVLKKCEQQLMTMDFERILSLLQREFAEAECGILDMKDPEPFIKEMREFRFMPDIVKDNGGRGSGSPARIEQNAVKRLGGAPTLGAQTSSTRTFVKERRLRWRRGGGCLSCFKGSATSN